MSLTFLETTSLLATSPAAILEVAPAQGQAAVNRGGAINSAYISSFSTLNHTEAQNEVSTILANSKIPVRYLNSSDPVFKGDLVVSGSKEFIDTNNPLYPHLSARYKLVKPSEDPSNALEVRDSRRVSVGDLYYPAKKGVTFKQLLLAFSEMNKWDTKVKGVNDQASDPYRFISQSRTDGPSLLSENPNLRTFSGSHCFNVYDAKLTNIIVDKDGNTLFLGEYRDSPGTNMYGSFGWLVQKDGGVRFLLLARSHVDKTNDIYVKFDGFEGWIGKIVLTTMGVTFYGDYTWTSELLPLGHKFSFSKMNAQIKPASDPYYEAMIRHAVTLKN